MDKSIFTEKEYQLVKSYTVKNSTFSHVVSYGCVLFTPVVFAVYGFLNEDSVAMFVAFGGLLIFVIWLLSTIVSSANTINSACEKIIKLVDSEDE